jgi:hypothetical protein
MTRLPLLVMAGEGPPSTPSHPSADGTAPTILDRKQL